MTGPKPDAAPLVGTSLRRVEDERFLTGRGAFTADRFRQGDLVCGFVRSTGDGRAEMSDVDYVYRTTPFWKQLLTKIVLLLLTIILVWVIYAYLHAFRLDWLGWIYSKLLPVTNGLYLLVETYFPDDVKFKIRGAITDDLGQRSLFLLLLTAGVELTLFCLFKLLGGAWRALTGR